MSLITLVAIVAAGALAVFVLMRVMRRLRLRAQFMVLCGLGLSIGFIFLALVELSGFSVTLGILLISIVFVASLFAVPIFLRSLDQEETDEDLPDGSLHKL